MKKADYKEKLIEHISQQLDTLTVKQLRMLLAKYAI